MSNHETEQNPFEDTIDSLKAEVARLQELVDADEKVLWLLQEAGHLNPGKLEQAARIVREFFGKDCRK